MKILILGTENKYTIDSMSSLYMLTFNIYEAFKKLNVELFLGSYKDIDNLPEVDFVLLLCYVIEMDVTLAAQIKQKTKCLKIVSLREVSFPFLDYSFIFNDVYKNSISTIIHLPANKQLLQPSKKIPKTILIDHYWESFLGTESDWTYKIEKWVETLVDEGYIFFRMIRFEHEIENIKSFEIPIYYSDYLTYLKNTEKIETYIITHKEGYPYSIIDMACRGTRICTPPDFIPSCMIQSLNIPIFSNEDQLLSILRNPIEDYWGNVNLKCTDYNDIALMINDMFKNWKQKSLIESPICNICESSSNKIIIEKAQDKETNLVECNDCGLRFFSPRIKWEVLKKEMGYSWTGGNEENLSKEANSLYEKGVFFGDIADPVKQINAIKSYYRSIYQQILDVDKTIPNSILEIGCSIGRFLEVCREKGITNLYGIDINPFSVKLANEKLQLNNVVFGDFSQYDSNNKFDWLVMLDYIEHSYHPKEDIKKAYKLLNENGTLTIKTFLEDLDPEHKMMNPPCHAYHFYGDVLYKLLRDNNFRILYWKVEYVHQQVLIIAKKI